MTVSVFDAIKIAAFVFVLVPFVLIVWRALGRDAEWCDQMQRDLEQEGRDIEKLQAAINAHAAPGEIQPVEGTTYKA